MEINDLTGLSKPITRLVEVIASGIGTVSKPYIIKKTADAKAYEIKVISEAMTESRKLLANSEYDNGNIKVLPSDFQPNALEELPNRTQTRNQYQELHRQQNIEAICANAAEELAEDTEIPTNKPEPEWISRFFNIAEEISTDELQSIWGRILSGEIKKPGSFSLRTLDVLRNLSKKEADNFAKLCNYILCTVDKAIFLDSDNIDFKTQAKLSFQDILALKDAGLIFESQLQFIIKPDVAMKSIYFIYGPIVLLFDRTKDTSQIEHIVGVLTKVGRELLQLVHIQPDMNYVKYVCQKFHLEGMKFSWAPLLESDENNIRFGEKTYIDL